MSETDIDELRKRIERLEEIVKMLIKVGLENEESQAT